MISRNKNAWMNAQGNARGHGSMHTRDGMQPLHTERQGGQEKSNKAYYTYDI
jgi:hypothetical protein